MPRSAMVVEDNIDVQELVSFILDHAGFDVLTMRTGLDALAHLSDADDVPDLIVLDLEMPMLDGWDSLAAIRGKARSHDVPVVVCSIRGHLRDRERAWALGCDGYVRKPFRVAELESAVVAACERPAESRAAYRYEQLELTRHALRARESSSARSRPVPPQPA